MGLSRLAPLVPLGLALAGCATLTEVNAGPVVALPTKEEPSVGGAAALHGAVGTSNTEARSMLAFDTRVSMKATSRTQHLAFGDGFVYGRAIGAKGEVLARAGLQLVFERFDEKLLVGGGPYATLLGAVTLDEDIYFVPGDLFPHTRRDRTLLTIGPLAEIDARFSRPTALTILGLTIGLAFSSVRLATPERIPVPEIFPTPPQHRPSP